MKLSEFIKELEKIQEKYGDQEFVLVVCDEGREGGSVNSKLDLRVNTAIKYKQLHIFCDEPKWDEL